MSSCTITSIQGRSAFFFAPNVAPSVDLAVPILHISGLDNYSLPHPNLYTKPNGLAAKVVPNAGSGPSGNYGGVDFRSAYVPGTSLTGAGQHIGLVEFNGYYPSDIAAYEIYFNLPNVTLTPLTPYGALGDPGTGQEDAEVSLDIEMAISMAPGISGVYIYEAPDPSYWDSLLSQMANDNLSEQISCSWAVGGPDATAEAIFQQMAAQGQSFFTSSGDSDAYAASSSIGYPEDSPNVTVVGGTTLTTTGPGGSYVSETVWNLGPSPQYGYPDGLGSSGGSSTYYRIPTYQQGVSMATNQGSTTMRNIPDVAMVANNIWIYDKNGVTESGGGTSAAAPLWAGLTALVNQQAAAKAQPPVGFLNPTLYTMCNGGSYNSIFHDITTGNNFNTSSPSAFSAVTGYDLCTGWGTPNGTALINALTTLTITTGSPLASGTVGSTYSQTLSAICGAAPYTWTIFSGGLPPGLSLSSAGVLSGIPTATGTYNFTIQVSDSAQGIASLSASIYIQQYTYSINSGGTSVTITGCAAAKGAISIPGTINGLTVTAIGNQAFVDSSNLTSITIPSSVTSIGAQVFAGCTRLTAINMTASNSAYSSLNGVLFNSNQTTVVECPQGLSGSYTIPSTVTSIGTEAFAYCSNLNIIIPSSVTTIGVDAFFSCSGLTGITIPSGVISIANDAFANCTGLTSVTIPSSVTSIGSGVFDGCTGLTAINMTASNSAYSSLNGVLFNSNQTTVVECPQGLSGSYTIPSTVTSIGSEAFGGCDSLTSVTIPISSTSIGASAFINCTGLTSITIGIHVNSIGSYAFEGCGSLTSVSIPSSVTSIGSQVFEFCTKLTAINMIASNPFYSSNNGVLFNGNETTLIQYPEGKTGSYTIPSSVTTIGNAFGDCLGLTSVIIPSTVASIGSNGFSGCANLTAINMAAPNSYYSSLNGVLFNNNQTTLIEYPEGLSGSYTIPSGVTSIGSGALEDCGTLTSVTIPSSVTSIGAYAFNGCTSLHMAIFDGNAPTTGSSVFQSTGNGFMVYYYNGATGFTSPSWKDSAGDTYPAVVATSPAITSANNTTFDLVGGGSFFVTATGAPSPTFSASGLPSWVTFAPNGFLFGLPPQVGTYNFTLTASNGIGTPATQDFSILVPLVPSITNGPPPTTALVNDPYSFTYTTTGYPTPTFSVISGDLPPGLALSSAGVFSGMPTVPGFFSGEVAASNGVGSDAQNFSILVQQVPVITSSSPPKIATVNMPYNFSFTSTGFPPPTFSVTSGNLPPGLTLSSAGVIYGAPTATGNYTVTVDATNGTGTDATESFTISITDSTPATDTPTMPPWGLAVLLMLLTMTAAKSLPRQTTGP